MGLTVTAPAKLNLILEVLAKRPDGFHEIRSVLQTISLCDELRFKASEKLEFKCSLPGWIAGESLVSKAAAVLRTATGCGGADIEVIKRIPLLSGLGGDSSDAIATLRGLNRLWGLGLSQKRLLELAVPLGSDVPFFLHGGTCLAEGRGEKVRPLPPLPRAWFVLVVPRVPRRPGKTGQLYASLNPSHFTDGKITERLVRELQGDGRLAPDSLFNTFESVAFTRFPELATYRGHIVKVGADNVHLAGSGPTLFTMLTEPTRAEDLYIRLRQQGLETYLVEPLAAGDIAAGLSQ